MEPRAAEDLRLTVWSLRAGICSVHQKAGRHGVPAAVPTGAGVLAVGTSGNVPACIGTAGPGGQRILFSERRWKFLCGMLFLNIGQFVS